MRNAIIKTIMCGAITILAWACSVNHAAKAAETDDFYHIEGNVIIDTEGNRYSCFFRTGQGEMDLEEALEMAEDVLAFTLYDYEKQEKHIPEPSKKFSLKENEFINYSFLFCRRYCGELILLFHKYLIMKLSGPRDFAG